MNLSALASQPIEIIQDILMLLHPLDIVHCRQVSRPMKEIIDLSPHLNLILDLYEEGFLLRPDYVQGSLQSEVEYLSGYKESLYQVKPYQIGAMPTSMFPSSWSIRFSQNHIAHLQQPITLGQNVRITFSNLKPPFQYHTLQIDPGIADFLFKPSDDLLICIRPLGHIIGIECLRISTGLPHPLAAEPSIAVVLENRVLGIWAILLGDCVIFIALSTPHHLVHFNWKTEKRPTNTILQLSDPGYKNVHTSNMLRISALTPDLILLIYAEDEDDPTQLIIYSMSQRDIICRLCLPIVDKLLNFDIVSPSLDLDDASGSSSRCFRYKRDSSLDVVVLRFTSDCIGRLEIVHLVISKARLLKVIDEASKDSNNARVPWSKWGNGVSMWIPGEWSSTSYDITSGHIASLVRIPPGSQAKDPQLVMFDFNPRPIKRRSTDYSSRLTPLSETLYPNLSRQLQKGELLFRYFESKECRRWASVAQEGDFLIERTLEGYNILSLFPEDIAQK